MEDVLYLMFLVVLHDRKPKNLDLRYQNHVNIKKEGSNKMPYRVTFKWRGKRRASEALDTKGKADWMKNTLVGLNPRIVPIKDMKSCPKGYKKVRGTCFKI